MIMTSTVVDCFNPLFITVANDDNYSMTIHNMTPDELLIRKRCDNSKLSCPTWKYTCKCAS